MENGPQESIELYDPTKDPGETRNLADKHPDPVGKAAALMKLNHSPSPDWPLTGPPPRRLAEPARETNALGFIQTRNCL